MNLRDISIQLSTFDVQEIIRIALDEDNQEALTFVKDKLYKKVNEALQPH